MDKFLYILCKVFVKFNFSIGAQLLYYVKYKLRTKHPWVLGRVACLGSDVFNLLNTDCKLYNVQKGRVDYLLPSIQKGRSIIKPNLFLLKFIKRIDIRKLILIEFFFIYNKKVSPEFLIIDSYSELTDQKFVSVNDENTFFFANYSDVDKELKNELKCEGLLEIDFNLEQQYENFFSTFRLNYSSTPIFFIHFPKALETRQKFIVRHDKIKEIINRVSKKITNMYVFEVPEEMIERTDDPFPYHFHNKVKIYLAEQINAHFEK